MSDNQTGDINNAGNVNQGEQHFHSDLHITINQAAYENASDVRAETAGSIMIS